MATIPIFNAPRDLTMADFKALSDMYGGLQSSCRFIVMIVPTGEFIQASGQFSRQLMYLCEVAEMPGRTFESLDVRYYGPNHKLPHKTIYEDINLTFICRSKSFERQFFDNWQLIINPINTWDFNYRDQYRAQIHIYQYSNLAKIGTMPGYFPGSDAPVPININTNIPDAQYWMTLHDAYPIFVNPQPMTWADDQFQRLIVSFTYHHWSRPGLDPVPRTGASQGFSFDLVKGSAINR